MLSPADDALFEKRFWEKVDYAEKSEDDCWIWIGKKNNYGYGIICRSQKELSAHRVSYERTFGKIPRGMVIDHLCRNRACVNPLHMQVVTNVENVMRGMSPYAQKKRWTHCHNGHSLSGENLKIRKNGTRFCRECDKLRARTRRGVKNG